MPQKLNDQKVEEIVELYTQDLEPPAIAEVVGCSQATVYRILRNLRFFNSPRAPPMIARGRPPKLTAEIAAALENYYLEYNTTSLPEAVAFVKEGFGVTLHPSTVSRFLRRIDISHQSVSPMDIY